MVCKNAVQKILCVFVTLLLVIYPKIGFSLGFGEIKLNSYLNEPLDAEIEIVDPEDIDIKLLIASLASTVDFTRAELPRPYYLTKLKFKVLTQDKRTIIHITSKEAMKQPFLEFLTVLSWPEGRLIKGFTLLLDPAPEGTTRLKESVQLSTNDTDSHEDLEDASNAHGKMARNQALLKSEKIAKNKKGVNSFDNANTTVLKKSTHDNQLESLFEPESEDPINNSATVIPKAKAVSKITTVATAPEKPPVNLPSKETAIVKQELEAPILSLNNNSLGVDELYKNKLLIGSCLAFLLAVGISTWFFRTTRENHDLSNPVQNVELFDQELAIKLVLADQYILIRDLQSAKDILEDILKRGNSHEREKAQNLLNKITTL